MRFNELLIHITDECNLACPYCFNSIRSKRYLSSEKILSAIRILFAERENDYFLHFIGGEPLLKWSEIKNVLRTLWIENNFIPHHSLTTNGKNLSIQIINEFAILNTKITLSIEGQMKRHQLLRPPFSHNDYDLLIKNTQLLVDTIGFENVIARITLYKEEWDITEEIEFLVSIGLRRFKILPDSDVSVDHCITSLQKLKNNFSNRIIEKQLSIFPLDNQLSIIDKTNCGVGERLICVATDGNFYPCHRFSYNKNLILGNINNGINEKVFYEWVLKISRLKTCCDKCAHSNRCSFPCAYPNITYTSRNWCSWVTGIDQN